MCTHSKYHGIWFLVVLEVSPYFAQQVPLSVVLSFLTLWEGMNDTRNDREGNRAAAKTLPQKTARRTELSACEPVYLCVAKPQGTKDQTKKNAFQEEKPSERACVCVCFGRQRGNFSFRERGTSWSELNQVWTESSKSSVSRSSVKPQFYQVSVTEEWWPVEQ